MTVKDMSAIQVKPALLGTIGVCYPSVSMQGSMQRWLRGLGYRNVLPQHQYAGAYSTMVQGSGLHLDLAAEYGNIGIVCAGLVVRP